MSAFPVSRPVPLHEPARSSADFPAPASEAGTAIERTALVPLSTSAEAEPFPLKGSKREDHVVWIDNIRIVSAKVRTFQARAIETMQQAQSLAKQASAATAAAEDRACHAEAALAIALARAERAEELVRSLASKLKGGTCTPAERSDASNLRTARSAALKPTRSAVAAQQGSPATVKAPKVGETVDIRLGDFEDRSRCNRAASPTIKGERDRAGPDRQVGTATASSRSPARSTRYSDFRNEDEFYSLTYEIAPST